MCTEAAEEDTEQQRSRALLLRGLAGLPRARLGLRLVADVIHGPAAAVRADQSLIVDLLATFVTVHKTSYGSQSLHGVYSAAASSREPVKLPRFSGFIWSMCEQPGRWKTPLDLL